MKRLLEFRANLGLPCGLAILVMLIPLAAQGQLVPVCMPAPSGLVGWWQGEGNANDSAGTNNGALSASGATYASGKVGQAFRFDGTNGFVQIPDADALKPTNITVEAWVWLDPSLPSGRGGEQIVFKKNTMSAWFEGYSLIKTTIDNGDGTFTDRFQFCVSRNGNQVAINSQTIAQRGVWYHVAATYDGNQSILYINGVAEAAATPGFALDYDVTPVFIGTSGTWPPYLGMFGGIIDEASIYNRALSTNEIQAIYNAGSAGKCVSTAPSVAVTLLNVDFGAGTATTEQGKAAAGISTNDFWNFYTRDDGAGGWKTFGSLTNLQNADGTVSAAGLTVNDAPGAWSDGSTDVMLNSYIYPFDGGNVTVTITNLPAGQYDVLPYSCNGNYDVSSGGISYGTNTCYGLPVVNPPVWTAGVQYTRFTNVLVNAGQPLVITAHPGIGDVAQISGLQIVLSSLTNALPPPPPIAPFITLQTPSQVVLVGNPATFTVNAGGSNPLNYFWSRNNVLIPNATNSSYTLFNAQLSDSGGKFSCFITNAYGSAASTNVTLKVIDTIANDLCSGAIIITNASYTNLESTANASSFGDPVPDCVDGFGNGVWYQFTAPVSGQLTVDTFGSDFDTGLAVYTGSCGSLTEIACNDDAGGDTSQVTLLTTAGTTYSILAGGYSAHTGNLVLHLNHLTPPAFAIQPADESVVVGNNANFNATLTGALPMSFQWYFNGTPLTDDGRVNGSATASLIISNITTADAGNYSLAATNFLGSTNSSAAVLNVLTPPVISTQPIGRSVPPGLPTTFNATATGNPAPNIYQWQLNGTNIPGATSSSYTVAAVGTNDLGFYHVVASNSVGGAVSADAQLTFGPVAAWGLNSSGECLPPPGLTNVFAIAGTLGVSFAVRTDGTIVSWGTGTSANFPANATNVVGISSSVTANYALRADGTVVGGNGITSPPAMSNIVSVAAGGLGFGISGYALRAEGTILTWGSLPTPGFPATLNHVIAIAAGNNNAVALKSDGTIVVSGGGAVTNVPSGLSNVVAIADGYTYAMALKANGTVVAWGSGTATNLPAGMTNIIAISAGNYPGENFGMAIRSNGTVVAWGDNSLGETTPPPALTNLVSIAGAAAAFHGLALVNDGSPVILHPPVGLTAYTGRDVTLQATAAGAQPLSYQWLFNGTNIPGATNTSLIIPNVQFANAGNYQLFVSNSINTALSLPAPLTVISNNTLTFLSTPAAQTNYQGSKMTLGVAVLGSGPLRYQWFFSTTNKNYTAVPGATNDTLVMDPALVINTGNYYVAVSNLVSGITNTPTFLRVLFAKSWGILAADPPFNVTNATAIAVGNAGAGSSTGHYLVLKSDGKIASWSGGFSSFGETNVAALSNSIVTAIAAGFEDSLALKSDGTVYAWGDNNFGETNVPAGLNGVTAIACGDYHDLALKLDGTVAAWGQSIYGQTTNAAATNVVAIAAGGQDSMALRADGSVVTWGLNGSGQFKIPFNATNIIAIAAGGQHFLALLANGTVVGWGNNSFGQTTIPAGVSNIVAISAGANHSVLLRNDGTVMTLGAYNGSTSTTAPADLANVVAIASSGDHDLALFGARAPVFTVQPWDRAINLTARTNIILAAKCAGVQPVHYQWQLNGTNIPGATNDTLLLTNNPSLQFGPIRVLPTGIYQLVASNAYGVATSQYAKITTFIPLGTALNATNLVWTTSGNAQWFGETNVTHDGVSAAQSGGIGALQETILQTTVGTNWSGRYTFWWKVSSEQDFDFLEFRVNGIVQTNISGEVNWQQVSIPVAAGTNVLQWRYSKDISFDGGQDAGWVDQFAYLADPPLITLQPVSQIVNMGTNMTFHVTAIGNTPDLQYQWRQNGNLIGGNSPTLILNNVGRAQNGNYFVTVTNSSGSTISSNAVLKVLVPQLLGAPVLSPDGTLTFTSTDENGGLLSVSNFTNFEAQASTNLVNWVTLTNALSLTNGMLQLQDNDGTDWPARFYRILEH